MVTYYQKTNKTLNQIVLLRQRMREYYHRNKTKCLAAKKKYRDGNIELKIRKSITNLKNRILILRNYGGLRCSLCDEKRFNALQLDHINGDGCKHRKFLNKHSDSFNRYLINQKFPLGYRVLCANCNIKEYLKRLVPKSIIGWNKNRKYYIELKLKVMNKLGGKCIHCNISSLEVLTINHINNDGAKHRREIKKSGGIPFYRHILHSDEFDGLECCCFSCNIDQEIKRRKSTLLSQCTKETLEKYNLKYSELFTQINY